MLQADYSALATFLDALFRYADVGHVGRVARVQR
jgi:hypothetical protein